MKYLKLITLQKLPNSINDGLSKYSHITIAYFGNVYCDENMIIDIINKFKKFKLRKLKSDLLGQEKNIPAVIYEIINIGYFSYINNIRYDLLNKCNILDRNYHIWTPHISNVDFNIAPDFIDVIGIESDDKSISINFTE